MKPSALPTTNRKLFLFSILIFTVGSDYCTKVLAEKCLESASEISFFNSLIKFSYVRNPGGFLGIINNIPETMRFFLLYICVALLLIGCLGYLFGPQKISTRYELPLVFVTGGGLSNFLDRILHDGGGVADFMSIGTTFFRTGIFNLADVYILLGSFILGYSLFSSPAKGKKPEAIMG